MMGFSTVNLSCIRFYGDFPAPLALRFYERAFIYSASAPWAMCQNRKDQFDLICIVASKAEHHARKWHCCIESTKLTCFDGLLGLRYGTLGNRNQQLIRFRDFIHTPLTIPL